MKEKGRKFLARSIGQGAKISAALCPLLSLPGPFFNRKEVFRQR
jgi:hypothetical protein